MSWPDVILHPAWTCFSRYSHDLLLPAIPSPLTACFDRYLKNVSVTLRSTGTNDPSDGPNRASQGRLKIIISKRLKWVLQRLK